MSTQLQVEYGFATLSPTLRTHAIPETRRERIIRRLYQAGAIAMDVALRAGLFLALIVMARAAFR